MGTDDVRRLLLISNSTLHGSGYLDHAKEEIRDLAGDRTRVVFIPFAIHDRKAYAASDHRGRRDLCRGRQHLPFAEGVI